MLRIVEDPDVDDESRVSGAGALLHVLSTSNDIPGLRGVLAYVDDVLVLRLVLERMEQASPDAMKKHREEFPELLEPLAEQLRVAREYLGERVGMLEKATDGVAKLSHHGHPARHCVFDRDGSDWLYETIHEALVDALEFDEDEVARAVKTLPQVLPPAAR